MATVWPINASPLAELSGVAEPNVIAIQPANRSSSRHLPAPPGQKALLTYQAMSNSDDIVLLLEHDGSDATGDSVVIGVNGAFRRASGLSNDQLLGLTVAGLFPNPKHVATLMTAIRGPGSLRSELTCGRADGGTFMLGMHLMQAPERTPGFTCFVVLGRDITAALEARQMQDSIQRLLAKVFASVDAAVAIVNSVGRIVMTNPRVDALLGYKPNGLVGRSTLDLVAPSSRLIISELIKRQLEEETDTTYSAPLLRADGTLQEARITSVIAATGDGKKFRILTLHPDAAGGTPIRSENVGKIKLVGLDEVRKALGDRWPAAAERAMATAEVVIKRHCGPQDSYSRVDDTSFMMCFGGMTEEESTFRAAMIGRAIRNRLIGQGEEPENAHVRAIAAAVRFQDQGETGPALQATLLGGLDAQLERLEQDARQTLHDALATAACDLDLIYGRDPAQVVGAQVLVPYRLERQLVAALSALPRKESDDFDPDGFLIGLAAQQAVTSMGQGDNTPLLVKINFDIFTARGSTDRFFAMCAKIDRRVTSRLVLLLSSLPEGLPRTRLQDCVNRLRPFCRGVGYQVDEVAELPEIDLSNSFNPILVLPVTACAASTPAKLRTLFTSLQTRRAKVLIRGVGSAKDAAALRSLGADMIAMKRPGT
jgi:PAS domain S-box-containing protein